MTFCNNCHELGTSATLSTYKLQLLLRNCVQLIYRKFSIRKIHCEMSWAAAMMINQSESLCGKLHCWFFGTFICYMIFRPTGKFSISAGDRTPVSRIPDKHHNHQTTNATVHCDINILICIIFVKKSMGNERRMFQGSGDCTSGLGRCDQVIQILKG